MTPAARGLAAVQLLDVLGNLVMPSSVIDTHLDRLGLARGVRPFLQPVKIAGSLGLILGEAHPPIGAASAIGLVGFYAGAVRFHVRAGDHPLVAAPAAALGVTAAALALHFASRMNPRVE
ncbi:MAG TPA: DoxX family protein [Acidimicrobiales bacterium]|nr:DoxX family protein [Acidimicrobiales bacterium]